MYSAQISTQNAVIILVLFGIAWVGFGWWLGRRNRTIDDFMLAGRNVGLALASATAMATWVTSNTTLVAPQLTYQFGIWGMVGYSMAALGLILFAPLAKRIKSLMPKGFTCGDFIRVRYGRGTWYVFLVVSFCYAMGWLISLGMAGGILLNALSGLNYHVGMTVILAICVGYTLLGGLRAVIATDFIQTVIILCGVLFIGYVCWRDVGLTTIYDSVSREQPQLLNLLFPAAIMFLFNNLFFGIGEIFHSNVWWSRAFAFRDGIGKRAYLISGLMWLPIPIVTGFIALAAPALGLYPPSPDMVGPMVAAKLLGSIGAVFVFIVVFSALASSLDSLLAATSDLLTEDVYRGLISPDASNAHLFKVSKWVILGLGVVTWVLCLPRMTTLGELLNFTGAFVASTIWPIVFGLYRPRLGGLYAGLAMALGTAIGLVAYTQIGFYVAALTSCLVSLAICLVGLALYDDEFNWERLQRMEK
ncbi:MAG: urea transporter [Pseudomonadales bacterium]|jgi:urea-proton symporter|nr:urea transporter [Pseudomonadales bacterium]TNC90496.1 MAG: urea transporter [Alcanivorax sp.]HAG95705.1 urea transporter [Gammaproteobacteria bacterium]MBI26377.1 urea transporter [Pseudomonadales bacterium]HAU14249.1 urea transporter [Gammaproteobacteria bacterium]|tara:strand:- start:13750 stop:15171 length:1422 start_codon:yes stop_codon:yes gene_type:complete